MKRFRVTDATMLVRYRGEYEIFAKDENDAEALLSDLMGQGFIGIEDLCHDLTEVTELSDADRECVHG